MNKEFIKQCIQIAERKRYLLRFEPFLSDTEYYTLYDWYTILINDFKKLLK